MQNNSQSSRSRLASRGAKLTVIAGTGLSMVLLTGYIQASSAQEPASSTVEQASPGAPATTTAVAADDDRENEGTGDDDGDDDGRESEDERGGDEGGESGKYSSTGSAQLRATRPAAPTAAQQPAPAATMSSQS